MFGLFKKKITVVTHNGSFHADDVFACATLILWAEKENINLKIVRSRDDNIIKKADIVVDVGDIYDPIKNRFDHHQRGGAGEHDNGIPYASFGLVWKKYGEQICNQEIAKTIENKLVLPIDAIDNGINVSKNLREDVKVYSVAREMIYPLRFSPDGKGFEHFIEIAKIILKSEINMAKEIMEQQKKVEEEITNQLEPEIFILNEDIYWDEAVTHYKKIKMVIYPEPDTNLWCAEATKDNLLDYGSNRAAFPESWRGLRDQALIKISGNSEAVFCHRAGFFAVAMSKEGAIEMARKALGMVS